MRTTTLFVAVLCLCAAEAYGRTERAWNFDGDRREENVGTSVAIAPDVDGDGSPDVVTGAPYHGPQAVEDNKGKAFLLSGVDGTVLRVYSGEVVYDGFGFAVAGLSDVDGDGKGDVAVAAPYLDSTAGRVYVFSGGSGAPETPLYAIEVADRILDGRALSGGPDVDGDQVGDLLVASFSRVALYSGVDGAFIREWSSEDGGENFGASAAFTGQVSDGLGGKAQGVLIGAPDRERPPGAFTKGRGRVYVFSAETGAQLRVLDGPDAGSSFGHAVANAGDMD
ncbi:MAG: integrin alpha, partial [Candidatus Methylomirabilis sp.]|nr:integrin alpha [Deltaproteobacteria bacterium]